MGRKGIMARWALGIVVGIVCFIIGLTMKHNSADCGGTRMTSGEKCVNMKTLQSKTVGQQESSNNNTKIGLLIVGPLVALGSAVFLVAEAKRKPGSRQVAFAAPIPLGPPAGGPPAGGQPQPSFGGRQSYGGRPSYGPPAGQQQYGGPPAGQQPYGQPFYGGGQGAPAPGWQPQQPQPQNPYGAPPQNQPPYGQPPQGRPPYGPPQGQGPYPPR